MDNGASGAGAYVSPPPLPPQAHLSAAFQAAAAAGGANAANAANAAAAAQMTQFQEALMSRMAAGRHFGLTVRGSMILRLRSA